MKKVSLFLLALIATLSACNDNDYDDSELRKEFEKRAQRLVALEKQSWKLNEELVFIQALLDVYNEKDALLSLTEHSKDMYEAQFEKYGKIIIRKGSGDIQLPPLYIGEIENEWCWTLNAEGQDKLTWLTDEDGNKITFCPQVRIVDETWEISTNQGKTWFKDCETEGEPEKSIFEEIRINSDQTADFILHNNITLNVPIGSSFDITFSDFKNIPALPYEGIYIDYSIKGADENTEIKILIDKGIYAYLIPTDYSSGQIYAEPGHLQDDEVQELIIYVSDGKDKVIIRSISFVSGKIEVINEHITVEKNGGQIEIPVSYNTPYTTEIQSNVQSWLAITETKSIQTDVLVVSIAANEAESRSGNIYLKNKLNEVHRTINILQEGNDNARRIVLNSPNTLSENLISGDKETLQKLILLGPIGESDIRILNEMQSLKTLNLSKAYFVESKEGVFKGNQTLETVILPEDGGEIIPRMFYESNIKNIQLPSNLETIGEEAFANCYQLEEIDFSGINNINRLSIEKYAFKDCRKLKTVSFFQKYISIYEGAFQDCIQLGKVIFESESETDFIPAFAFQNCIQLKSIQLPKSVTSIGREAFEGCIQLKEIYIPAEVGTIYQGAFANCTQLNKVSFAEESELMRISVSEEEEKEVTIGSFQNCTSLTGITLPSTPYLLGAKCFYECENLETIVIPGESKISVLEKQIIGKTAITTFTLPVRVSEINEETFAEAGKLQTFIVPEESNLETIHDKAFAGVTHLEEFRIYKTNTVEIEEDANPFGDLEGIPTLYIPQGEKDRYLIAEWDRWFEVEEMN